MSFSLKEEALPLNTISRTRLDVAIPDLQLQPGGFYTAEATGVPDPGLNVFSIPFAGNGVEVSEDDLIFYLINPDPQAPSIANGQYVGISNDGVSVTFNFTIANGGPLRVVCVLNHSIVR